MLRPAKSVLGPGVSWPVGFLPENALHCGSACAVDSLGGHDPYEHLRRRRCRRRLPAS